MGSCRGTKLPAGTLPAPQPPIRCDLQTPIVHEGNFVRTVFVRRSTAGDREQVRQMGLSRVRSSSNRPLSETAIFSLLIGVLTDLPREAVAKLSVTDAHRIATIISGDQDHEVTQ